MIVPLRDGEGVRSLEVLFMSATTKEGFNLTQ